MAKKVFTDESLKTLIDETKTYIDSSIQTPDWNQNNESAKDYIKNRPFYETEPVETIIAEGTIPAGEMMQISANTEWLKLGETYTAVFDGITYNNLVCEDFDGIPSIGSDLFVFAIQSGTAMAYAQDRSVSHSIKVISYVSTVFPLERKYIAEHIDILAGEKVEGKVYTIDEIDTVAENGAEIFNDYNKNIATGKYSHAEGSNTIASGDYSHAEGLESVASGAYAHAEGVAAEASGNVSHAEGSQTVASGFVAHAEGRDTEATNEASHAEGFGTHATGTHSHAQGDNSTASGKGAHAEGYSTVASGSYAHAEGHSTIAGGRAQHVQGKYNIEDASSEYELSEYAHIVGNGTSNTARSNAHTVDWEGNANFAGDVYVGNANENKAGKKLATEEYVNLMAGSSVQTPDWNQNDETAADYIKNRTHYENIGITRGEELTSETNISFLNDGDYYELENYLSINTSSVEVVWDGISYICDVEVKSSSNFNFGDIDLVQYPFYYINENAFSVKVYGKNGYHTMAIYECNVASEIKQLDEKFIPNTIARTSQIEEAVSSLDTIIAVDENSDGNVELRDYIPEEDYIGLDPSLTHQGFAADAKAVGDAIADIRSLIGTTGGTSLPEASTSDNGKFLRVVNGVPTWVSLSNAEEASF